MFTRWKPGPESGWIHKCILDSSIGRHLPVPTEIISNEEYEPPPQTAEQAAVERRLLAIVDDASAKLGIDRRGFLRSAGAMAAGFLALNDVFGGFYDVSAEELYGAPPRQDTPYFVFDVQTHHVDLFEGAPEADRRFIDYLVRVRQAGANWNPKLADREIHREELTRETYVKEIFLDSQTDVAVISGLPQMHESSYLLSPEQMARTRTWVNDIARSERVLTHGVLSPELGQRNLEAMHAQVEVHKVSAWKGYPGQPLGPNGEGWWLDDEKVAYPALELCRKLNVRNVCSHKGLPAPGFSAEHCHPRDVFKASRDFQDLNFLIYHAGFRGVTPEVRASAANGFRDNPAVPWVTDICEWKKAHPEVTNVYMELGATFGMTAITQPMLCAHMLGMMLQAFGPDRVLWGTDSIWWGSPQWQIEALKRFEIPEALRKRFGYAPLTPDVKAKILGLNAARVYGVDPAARRNPLPDDAIDRLRAKYKEGLPMPSLSQYGWVRDPARGTREI